MPVTLNNFVCHHLQNDLYPGNNLNQLLEVSRFYLDLLLTFINSAFEAIVPSFAFKTEIFTRLKISDLSTNLFFRFKYSKFKYSKFKMVRSSKIFCLNVCYFSVAIPFLDLTTNVRYLILNFYNFWFKNSSRH